MPPQPSCFVALKALTVSPHLGRLTITERFCLRSQRGSARDSRLNPIAYGAMTGASGFRAWLFGNVGRCNGLDDDLHAAAVMLANQA